MNKNRYFLATLAVFVATFVLDIVINNVILAKLYLATASLWRPMEEMQRLIPWSFLVYVVTALVFTYMYAKGYEGKPSRIGEGMRFGLLIGLLTSLPMAVMCYITMPIPSALAWGGFLTGMGEFALLGIVAGLVYHKA